MTVPNALRARRSGSPRAKVSLSLLGPPRVERSGRVVEFETRKAVAILAYLALEGGTQARDRLAAMFWPDAEQERARASLRRTLSPLRTQLGEDVLVADTVSVHPGKGTVVSDVERFRALLREGKLGEAARLYRGDLLAGFSLKDNVRSSTTGRLAARRTCAGSFATRSRGMPPRPRGPATFRRRSRRCAACSRSIHWTSSRTAS